VVIETFQATSSPLAVASKNPGGIAVGALRPRQRAAGILSGSACVRSPIGVAHGDVPVTVEAISLVSSRDISQTGMVLRSGWLWWRIAQSDAQPNPHRRDPFCRFGSGRGRRRAGGCDTDGNATYSRRRPRPWPRSRPPTRKTPQLDIAGRGHRDDAGAEREHQHRPRRSAMVTYSGMVSATIGGM